MGRASQSISDSADESSGWVINWRMQRGKSLLNLLFLQNYSLNVQLRLYFFSLRGKAVALDLKTNPSKGG